ncbi:imidazole glycerol phosphate synthase subunit HisH [Geomonas azotofigens]|uniref:imidazole glycerol phosphate synthase subunit HisH n=1 Tax=Geomonas azotofigens TaxID=2843196 RepID=UPI001C10B8FB|nr:imidazole glycerol phosphate synthase subunit HisH [Geomonas azotofigens]MBU5613376.1 imidazole glycerol phosphate synthase subunit HisH [Geomonas azotofigens]
MITIVDYGMGNIGSIANMFKKIGVPSRITGDPDQIASAQKILLPGVGSFDAAMSRIAEQGIREVLDRKALVEKVPVLGICLGMQLLTDSSEEGQLPGLGWIPAQTLAFTGRVDSAACRVPHMGWNVVTVAAQNPVTQGFESVEEMRFYFVHSYFVRCRHPENVLLKTTHGVSFDSAIFRDNIYGAQFHPEKSHKYGMMFLENFARL